MKGAKPRRDGEERVRMSKTAGEGFQSLSILHSLPNVFFEFEDVFWGEVDLSKLFYSWNEFTERGYLLCTVGSVYIKSKEAPAKDVLKDLVEMCHGIQHPVCGLFLRSYLSQISRDKLPDIGSEYEGCYSGCQSFILFADLELRIAIGLSGLQGPVRDKERREKKRSELHDLVISVVKYDLAQYYLMDCIIQVFPDEYHLQTLETLLAAFPQLQSSVDIKTVLSRLMERLSNYAASSPEVLPEFLQVEAFAKLKNAIGKRLSV
ncbi:hypothetical protein ACSBR1_017606 [Camellia fascicularis]